jgi:hypothetical protein
VVGLVVNATGGAGGGRVAGAWEERFQLSMLIILTWENVKGVVLIRWRQNYKVGSFVCVRVRVDYQGLAHLSWRTKRILENSV